MRAAKGMQQFRIARTFREAGKKSGFSFESIDKFY
jgi:hypothetical protein